MNNREQDTFRFTYSAKEQEEIKAIRQKYEMEEPADDKMAHLRRLDGVATQKATVVSLVFGILGALVLGMGMSLAMTDIGQFVGLTGGISMLVGVLIGLIGIVMICVAYPIYVYTLERQRKKIAPEIIRLTDELMK